MYFYNKRVYHKLSEVPINNQIVVCAEKHSRYFMGFNKFEEFNVWYKNVKNNDKTLNEIIKYDLRKLILDIDGSDDRLFEGASMYYNFEKHITNIIKKRILDTINLEPEILVYNMCDGKRISYHFVVTNMAFTANTCYSLCNRISYGQIWESFVDNGVYKKNQSMRIEGSKKYGKQIVKPYINLKKSMLSIVSGLPYFDLFDLRYIDVPNVDNISINNANNLSNVDNLDIYSASLIETTLASFPDFKIRCTKNNIIFLNRIRPSYCEMCKRIHMRENAAIFVNKLGLVFYCWRMK